MKVYCADEGLSIRSMIPSDAKIIFDTYQSYGWHPSMETYEAYFREQEEGKRLVFIAEREKSVSGLCVLTLYPKEGPWANGDIPEIEDLTVFYHVHRLGIGSRLMDAAEAEAAKRADRVYLAVGLHAGYGPAQRMYVKRGYVPDGSGVWYKGKPLEPYAPCVNDDELVLYLSKKL